MKTPAANDQEVKRVCGVLKPSTVRKHSVIPPLYPLVCAHTHTHTHNLLAFFLLSPNSPSLSPSLPAPPSLSLSLSLTHTAHPPSKRKKLEKKTRAEKGIEKAVDTFMKYQLEAEERYKQYEDERWQKEVELEEKRQREDQQYEIRLMGMMASMFQGSQLLVQLPSH